MCIFERKYLYYLDFKNRIKEKEIYKIYKYLFGATLENVYKTVLMSCFQNFHSTHLMCLMFMLNMP